MADAERKRRHREYMRDYRHRLEIRERPEARVVDRTIVAALAEHLKTMKATEAMALVLSLHELAKVGLIREGFDPKEAQRAIAKRIREFCDENPLVSSVAGAAADQRNGRRAANGRVRHHSRLER